MFQHIACLHGINLICSTHVSCACSAAAATLRRMISPIKENRLLFEDDIEEVMYLYMDTSPLETSVLYSNESRRVVSRWMPFLTRSAKNIADQLNNSNMHDLVTVVSRRSSAAAHD